jgi:hypothetical protein
MAIGCREPDKASETSFLGRSNHRRNLGSAELMIDPFDTSLIAHSV